MPNSFVDYDDKFAIRVLLEDGELWEFRLSMLQGWIGKYTKLYFGIEENDPCQR